MTITPLPFAHPPRDPSGDWQCNLPSSASIGELKLWATAATSDPWGSAPSAPTGTTISVASTFLVPASRIDSGGLSFLCPAGPAPFDVKMLLRCTGTPPQAAGTVGSWRWFEWYADDHADGSYASTALESINVNIGAWTWYGPGDTTTDGLTLPSNAGALYAHVAGFADTWRIGSPLVNLSFETFTGAGLSGTNRSYYSTSTTTLYNAQRIDNISTSTTPLIPYQV